MTRVLVAVAIVSLIIAAISTAFLLKTRWQDTPPYSYFLNYCDEEYDKQMQSFEALLSNDVPTEKLQEIGRQQGLLRQDFTVVGKAEFVQKCIPQEQERWRQRVSNAI